MLMRFMRCPVFNWAFYGMFMEYSWGVQPVLGVLAFLATTIAAVLDLLKLKFKH